jgi:hypothetical protein
MMDRTELAALVEPLNHSFAEMLRAEMTSVEQVPTPFFGAAAIYRVTHMLPTRPVVFTVGTAGRRAALLPNNPDAYVRVARAGELRLQDDAARLAYVVTYLETTRSFGERFQILRSVDEIVPRRGLDAQQTERFEAIRSRFRDQITPPAIAGRSPWGITVFAIHGQALEQITLVLDPDASIHSTRLVLEPDLPIPYAR